MLTYPDINPIAFHIGSFNVHWYGVMYLVGFLGAWILLSWRLRTSSFSRGVTQDQLADIIFYCALGVIIGGRLGYMIFYAWSDLMRHPFSLFQIWRGGMSFHGGLIGVLIALYFYTKRTGQSFFTVTDFIAPVVPIGLAAGRIGNFINGELFGRITNVPWAMIFPNADASPRHPSQLYEFFFEGVLLFLVLWFFSKNPKPRGAVSGLFLMLYAVFRFSLEFFREPDIQLGFVAGGWLTQGQLLSVPLFLFGIFIFVWAYRRNTA